LKAVHPVALKDLMEFVPAASGPIPISEVEPIESIRRRFTTAAMSLGALSPEAHEMLAIAMNRIGGKSDSGRAGKTPVASSLTRTAIGRTRRSSRSHRAASRVRSHYLVNAEQLEIKMAQGAKPGKAVNCLAARSTN